MWLVKVLGDANCESEMICVQCQEHLKAKIGTVLCHLERKHPSSLLFSN